jgi:hypothetical protein
LRLGWGCGGGMKICTDCGHEFTPKGRQKVCGECKHEEAKLQKTDEEAQPKEVRPIDRLNRKVVFQGQSGLIRR